MLGKVAFTVYPVTDMPSAQLLRRDAGPSRNGAKDALRKRKKGGTLDLRLGRVQMDDPSGFYLLMLLPPLLTAFIIQFFVSARVRGKVIIRTAAVWTVPVLIICAIGGDGPLDILVRAAIFGGIGMALALIGSLIGSELSTLTRRLLGRSAG